MAWFAARVGLLQLPRKSQPDEEFEFSPKDPIGGAYGNIPFASLTLPFVTRPNNTLWLRIQKYFGILCTLKAYTELEVESCSLALHL